MPLPGKEKPIPIKITPCPIVDASAEIRFTPNIPAAAVFGILYGAFQKEYEDLRVESLPILQIPEDIRTVNSELQFQPHYKISTGDLVIQIGAQVLTVGWSSNYPGWNVYKGKIVSIFSKVKELNIANKISRIGLRYINFFQNTDIFEKLDMSFSNEDNFLVGNSSLIKTEIKENSLVQILQISNSGGISRNGENLYGSFIDVDTSTMTHIDNFFESTEEHMDYLHDAEKKLFFNLLKSEYLKEFNPIYNE